jgi:ribosome recycling factor
MEMEEKEMLVRPTCAPHYYRIVRQEAEGGRVAVRNIRRDAMHDVKELLKEKMIGEDEERRAEGEIQEITDKYVAEIDEILAAKEAELMEI